MKRVAVACLGLAGLLTIAAAGCLFSPDPKSHEDPPLPATPFPDSPDQLMANFKVAYVSRQIDDYRTVLGPNYEFIMKPEDVAPGASDRFDCAEEMTVAANMFSGEAMQPPDSPAVPGILGISIPILQRQGSWIAMSASDPDFPLTQKGLYAVQVDFAREGGSTIIVTGLQEFYVSARDSLVDGVLKPYYQLRGQRDLSGSSKGVEDDSWGAVKCLYSN